MNKLKTTDSGGFPFQLDDLRWIFGQGGVTAGIYQVLNTILRSLGDSYILYGCDNLGAGACSAGLIMLDGELLMVDAHTSTSTHFAKVTTYDATGLKTFQDATTHDTYQKDRATVSAGSGSLEWATAPYFIDLVKTQKKEYTSLYKEIVKAFDVNYPNASGFTLDGTKNIAITSGAGTVFTIEGTAPLNELSTITETPGLRIGTTIFIKISAASVSSIQFNTGTGAFAIRTMEGVNRMYGPGTLLMLQATTDYSWHILAASSPGYDVGSSAMLCSKVVSIGDWNMFTTGGGTGTPIKAVAHGLADHKKIRSMTAVIRNDADTLYWNLCAADNPDGAVEGTVAYADATNINLISTTGGAFDAAGYSTEGGYSRGWVTIWYNLY